MTLNSSQHARFLRMYANVQTKLYTFILSIVHNKGDSDELFQEISIFLWEQFTNYCEGSVFSGTYSGGTGLGKNPYRISTLGDWQELNATPGVTENGKAFPLEIELKETDRFLTLAVTDGRDQYRGVGNLRSTDSDWCVFVRPALIAGPLESEKTGNLLQ